MKRWWPAFLVVLLACLPIWLRRSESPAMLSDTDTRVLLTKLEERADPLSWFRGDWPLENHFYRPISTMLFEADHALYGWNAAGYGRTNALLCILGILLLFWFLREFTDSPAVSAAGGALFALWTLDGGYSLSSYVGLLGWFVLVAGALRYWHTLASSGRAVRPRWYAALGGPLLAWLALRYLGSELDGVAPLWMRNVGWLPGRTATTMTVFALGSLGAYARFERLRSEHRRTARTKPLSFEGLSATDVPNTKSATLGKASGPAWPWAVLACLCLCLALGAYEQAVMVPACLVAVAVAFRGRGARPQWLWQFAFWGILFGYVALRHQLVPTEVSGYQRQQFRASGSVGLAILDYAFPEGAYVPILLGSLDLGWEALLFGGVAMGALLGIVANLAGYWVVGRRWALGFGSLAMSVLAYLPMAWLKPFDHYHYWPMAMRALFVVLLGWGTFEAVASAVSPPTRRAPPRPRPAPGSLPRP
ncbi:MAG: hypothetical protein KIS66_11055 [Fimbriimonadaceae bacterium]|nr:hypothetical protein [Fimbriimonadaceae bacterium]